MLTKANPDNKTFEFEVDAVAVHVPDVPALKPVLQSVHAVVEEQTLQFDGHDVVQVGAAVAYPEAHNKQDDVELKNQQFEIELVPVMHDPLAYKSEPVAQPPVHDVAVAEQSVGVPPPDGMVYPWAATMHVVADITEHPVTKATQVPGPFGSVAVVGINV